MVLDVLVVSEKLVEHEYEHEPTSKQISNEENHETKKSTKLLDGLYNLYLVKLGMLHHWVCLSTRLSSASPPLLHYNQTSSGPDVASAQKIGPGTRRVVAGGCFLHHLRPRNQWIEGTILRKPMFFFHVFSINIIQQKKGGFWRRTASIEP